MGRSSFLPSMNCETQAAVSASPRRAPHHPSSRDALFPDTRDQDAREGFLAGHGRAAVEEVLRALFGAGARPQFARLRLLAAQDELGARLPEQDHAPTIPKSARAGAPDGCPLSRA